MNFQRGSRNGRTNSYRGNIRNNRYYRNNESNDGYRENWNYTNPPNFDQFRGNQYRGRGRHIQNNWAPQNNEPSFNSAEYFAGCSRDHYRFEQRQYNPTTCQKNMKEDVSSCTAEELFSFKNNEDRNNDSDMESSQSSSSRSNSSNRRYRKPRNRNNKNRNNKIDINCSVEAAGGTNVLSISNFRSLQTNYKNAMQSIKVDDVVKQCRQDITEETEKYLQKHEKSYKAIAEYVKNSSNKKKEVWLEHQNIIKRQQMSFDQSISGIRSDLTDVYSLSNISAVESCDAIIEDVRRECNLFNKCLPIYAFKNDIIKSVAKNSVTIIAADTCYNVSGVIPHFLLKTFADGLIVSCQPNVALCNFFYRFSICLTNNNDSTSLVAYQLDGDNQKTVDTKILFTTQDQLFQSQERESDFPSILCVIVNCALQRETHTDFLLESLRRCILSRQNFHLVITVHPNEDILSFEKYFGVSNSLEVIQTPNLTLPVSIVWKKGQPSENYLDDVVETACAIHVLNDPGNVLIFVPACRDIKKASDAVNTKLHQMNYQNFYCECLYGNIGAQPDLAAAQSKSQKRKFIFTSNWAVQMDFPNVAYIIDVGLIWDSCYDSEMNLELKKYKFISQASAKLRKAIAGSSINGICYRLYNKHTYKYEMPICEIPIILQDNPFDIVMKTFQYRRNDAINMEFIQNLPETAKENALLSLEKSNAIKNGQLTYIGEKIIKLPFLPRYSKMLILGEQWGYGYETILLVAFFMTKQSVFVRSFEKKKDQQSEYQKLQFLVGDSDTFTFLNVFHLWTENKSQASWCNEHAIDFIVLEKIRKQAGEIHKIVTQQLQADIVPEVRSTAALDLRALQEIIFESFKDNLCIYSGHYRSGYHSFNTHCMAFLHPSSPVLRKTELPQFVVFESMQTTSRNFMMNVTFINPEIVMNDPDLSLTYSKLLEIKLEPFVIEHVGITLIKRFLLGIKGLKLHDIEQQVKKEIKCNLLVIEPSEEKGIITIYTLPQYGEKSKKVIQDLLQEKRKDILHKQETLSLELDYAQRKVAVSVKWMEGCSTIEIKNSYNNSLQNDKDQVESSKNVSPIKYSVNLTWMRRLGKGIGFVTFSEQSFQVARRLSTKSYRIGNSEADVQLSKLNANQLYISNLDSAVSKEELESAITSLLPSDIFITQSTIVHQNPFKTTLEDIMMIRKELENACVTLMEIDEFTIEIPMPENSATEMRAFINMEKSDDMKRVAEYFNDFIINNVQVKAKTVCNLIVFCSIKTYHALENNLQAEFNKLEKQLHTNKKVSVGNGLFRVNIAASRDCVTAEIKLQSNDIEVMNILSGRINNLLEGIIVDKHNLKGIQKLFTHGGHLWLRALEKEENIHIVENYKIKALRLYGSNSACKKSIKRISSFLVDVENEVVKPVDLSSDKNTRSLMKELIQTYGFDLKQLIEKFQLRSAELDIRQCKMMLHGSGINIEKALNEIEMMVANSSEVEESFSLQESCCICRMPPLHLSVLLEHCTHLYCMECLKGWISNAEFPILCCAENCNKEIVLEDIHKVLDDEGTTISDLLHRSMTDYISKNSERYVYCPAPDCSMFFDKTQMFDNNKWNCNLCGNDICPKCNVVYHHGYTCEIYQGSKADPDFSYKQWLKGTSANCKQCPNCQTAIEKTAGCNHMTCSSCRGHFCWLCLMQFRTGNEVYNHLPRCKYYGM